MKKYLSVLKSSIFYNKQYFTVKFIFMLKSENYNL